MATETLHIPLPAGMAGDTTFFRLKGKPFGALLRIGLPDGTVITAPLAAHGQIDIFCGACRGQVDVELRVPDSELITTSGAVRVPGPKEGTEQ